MTTQGIALADLTPEAFLHYVWQSRDHGLTFKGRGDTGRGQFPGQLAWQVLRDMGHFPLGTLATLRAAMLTGRRTIQELVDRYDIRPRASGNCCWTTWRGANPRWTTPVTDTEWSEFEEHFDWRKVELGGCARPYGSACQHEHVPLTETVGRPWRACSVNAT